ncbi:neuromedin-U receptor 1 [Thomomys bottae]
MTGYSWAVPLAQHLSIPKLISINRNVGGSSASGAAGVTGVSRGRAPSAPGSRHLRTAPGRWTRDGGPPGGAGRGTGVLPGALDEGRGSSPGALDEGLGSSPGALDEGRGSSPGALDEGRGSSPGAGGGGRGPAGSRRRQIFLPAWFQTPLCPNCSSLPGDLSPDHVTSPVSCNGSEARGPWDLEDLNLTDEALRIKYLGPQQMETRGPISAIYLLIFVVGVVGNGLTCVIVLHHKAMHTPTNFYLLSLAVSDLLVLLVGLPLELHELWHNYPFLLGPGGCYLRTLLFETVCLASVLNVTALSVERYVAVVQPLKARSVVTWARVRRVLAVIWVLAVLCSLPNTSLHGLQELYVPCRGLVPHSTQCTLVHPRGLYSAVVQVTMMLFFALPMATISVLYLLVGRRLRQERLQLFQPEATARASCSRRVHQLLRGRRQVTKMLVVLVVVFGLCWAPFHAERLMWSFVSHWSECLLLSFQWVHILSGVFFYFSSAANPVLYSLMSSRFRETFWEALGLRTQCHRHARHNSSHSLSRQTTASVL